MTKGNEVKETQCLNCGAQLQGAFCHHCGQKARENTERSLRRIIGEFFENIFFVDNRFFISIKYLFRYPGKMTIEFLSGKRKKFISPVTLFLFFNLIYFIVNPTTDYSLSYYDQVYYQPFSSLIQDGVTESLQKRGIDEQAYAEIYQETSDDVSKSIMIINVPLIAFFVYVIAFWKRKFYFDSLIFSFHFFSLLIISWVFSRWSFNLVSLFNSDENSMLANICFALFGALLPYFYAVVGIKKFMDVTWFWAVLAGIGVSLAIMLSNLVYRPIIFFITFWITT